MSQRFIPQAMRSAPDTGWSDATFAWGDPSGGWTGFLPNSHAHEFPHAVRLVPILFAIVDRLAQDVSALPVKFYRRQRNGKRVEIDPFEKGTPAERWKFANPYQSSKEVELRRCVSYEQNGNAYLIVDRGRLAKKLPPTQLRLTTVPGHRMRPLPDEYGPPAAWEYAHPTRGPITIDPEDVIPFASWSNEVSILGMSRLEALRQSYHTMRDAGGFQREFFRKGGAVAGFYSTDSPSPVAVAAAESKLKARHQGLANAFDPVILTGGLKYERRGLTFAEMNFLESMRATAEDCCRGYGVPPVIMGFKEGGGMSDAGASTDMLRYVEGGLVPRLDMRDGVLCEWYCPLWGDDIEAKSDTSGLFSVTAQRLEMAQALVKLTGRPIYSVNMALADLGKDPRPEPEADELHLPPGPSINIGDKPAAGEKAKKSARADDPEAFDETTWRSRIEAALADAAEAIGEAGLASVALDVAIDWTRAAVAAELHTRAGEAMAFLTQTTRDQLRDTLDKLSQEGASHEDVVRAIREVYDGRRDNAITAAQTETHAAGMYAVDYGWRESGEVDAREWDTAGDEVVRQSHRDVAERGAVPMGEPFLLYDDEGQPWEAMYPGDRSLPPALAINCRCIMTAVLKNRARVLVLRGGIDRAVDRHARKLASVMRDMYDAMERDTLAKLSIGTLLAKSRLALEHVAP